MSRDSRLNYYQNRARSGEKLAKAMSKILRNRPMSRGSGTLLWIIIIAAILFYLRSLQH